MHIEQVSLLPLSHVTTTHQTHHIVCTSKCNHGSSPYCVFIACIHRPPLQFAKHCNKCFGSHRHITTYQKHCVVRSPIHGAQLFAAPPCIYHPPLQPPKQCNKCFGPHCNIMSQLRPHIKMQSWIVYWPLVFVFPHHNTFPSKLFARSS